MLLFQNLLFLTLVILIIILSFITPIIQCWNSIWLSSLGSSRSNGSKNPSFDAYQLPFEAPTNDVDDCQENRIEAIEVGRQCSRRCRKDVPCENTRKHCLCDGLCGLSCIKPDLSCVDLPKIENGDYQPKSFKFNDKVVYQCQPGYYLFGSRERLCQGDEDWSGTPAECLAEPMCRNPVKVNHARNPNDGYYRLNDRVSYSCYPGYQSRGSSDAVCKLVPGQSNHTAWVWSGGQSDDINSYANNGSLQLDQQQQLQQQQQQPFRCLPKSCGDPGQVDNGKRHGDSFIIASSVMYTCNEGYEMVGQSKRYCQSDSQWSGQPPKCEPITCNPTDHLENGKINYVYPLVFNSTVEYTCDYGFRLVGGPRRRTCGPERKLIGEVPSCVEIDCGDIGQLPNGYIKGFSSRMGDRKEFVCMEGMKFQGKHRDSVCLESGLWSNQPLPQCLAPCIVPHIEHSSRVYIIPAELIENQQAATNGNGSGNSFSETIEPSPLDSVESGVAASHGSYLEVVCDKDYELDEQMDENNIIQAPVCNNSTWSYEPRCKPASCKSTPPSPKNGRVRIASMAHGARGYLHCLDGFKLRGDNSTECINGNWTPINSQCIEIYCVYPGAIEHGRVLLVGLTGMYDYKPYIKRISNNRQIAYECDPGYHLNDGAPTGATCMEGLWRPEGLPNCIKE